MAKARLIFGLIILFGFQAVPAHSQIQAGDWAISPWVQNMLVGDFSPLQVLNSEWQELGGAEWFVSDENLALIVPDEQHKNAVAVRALAPGEVTVTARLFGTTHSIVIDIWPEHFPPEHRARWSDPAFGKRINEVKAMRSNGDEPDLYFATQSGPLAAAHATDMQGLQLWGWTIPGSEGNSAKLLCADDAGGILVELKRASDYVLYSLSAKGALQWTYYGHDKLQSHALGFDGTLYLVEAGLGHLQVRLVALDATQGKEKFTHSVPQSVITRNGVATERFSCIPGFHQQAPQASVFSRLLVNTDGNAYFAFTVSLWELEGVNCTPETASRTVEVRRRYENSLFLWQISQHGDFVTTLVQRDQGIIEPSPDLTPMVIPTGDLIPDNEGGVLLSVRQVPRGAPGAPLICHDYVYRITDEGKVAYKLALPPFPGLRIDGGMVLNEDSRAFTTVGGLVLCFDSISGKEVWRYNSQTPKVSITYAAEGGGLVVENSLHHLLVLDKDGKKISEENMDPALQKNSRLPD